MNRPLKMAGPKKSVLNLGRAKNATEDSGLYYNSSMGPMKMHSPSALKQMEEEMGAGGGMEEMMGMMGEGPVEGAPVEKEGGEDGAKQIFGQEMTVKEDGTIVVDSEYGIEGVPPGAEVKDPNGILEFTEDGGDKYVMDENYTFEVEGNTVIITGIEGEVDPDAPGTPGTEGYEPPVRREDLDDEGKAIWDKHRE